MMRRMLDSLELPASLSSPPPPQSHMAPILQADHRLGSKYKPLLTRPTAGKITACRTCFNTTYLYAYSLG